MEKEIIEERLILAHSVGGISVHNGKAGLCSWSHCLLRKQRWLDP